MYQDKSTIIQVLGSLLQKPSLLSETEKYRLVDDDFPERFHRIVFAAINNLYHSGNETINEVEVDAFLKSYDIQYKVFNQNGGVEYLESIQELAEVENFDYHYNRLKKFSLIREMEGLGFDVSEIYDDSIIDPKEREAMQENFDGMSIEDILMFYDSKMIQVKEKFKTNSEAGGIQAGEGVQELLKRLSESPDVGVPMNSEILTSLLRGARKKKFYIRSSITGGGKTRNMIADACRISATHIYDLDKKEWVKNDFNESSVVISTEMIFEELQTPALAYISGIEEDNIIMSNLTEEEKERVIKAAEVLENSNIWFEHLPDFNVREIERTIEKNIIQNNVEYVYFDYIHSTVTTFSELTSKSRVSLREDQILLLMATKLKDICNKYDVHLTSATQLNGDWKEAWIRGEEIDSNLIRGAKSIVDKTDAAMITLPISKKEKKEIQEILKHGFYPEPDTVTHLFKNRGNPKNKVKIFSKVNLGNMRIEDCFITNYDNELINYEKIITKVKE